MIDASERLVKPKDIVVFSRYNLTRLQYGVVVKCTPKGVKVKLLRNIKVEVSLRDSEVVLVVTKEQTPLELRSAVAKILINL